MNKETYIPQELFEHYDIYMFDINRTKDVYNLILKMWKENQQLKQRIDEALDYINEKAPKVSTLILDTENKVKLLAILKGANEKELYKEILKGSENNDNDKYVERDE